MPRRAQAMLEYLLLLALVSGLSFAAFKGGIVNKTLQTVNQYFKTGVRGITGGYTLSNGTYVVQDPQKIDGSWCQWTTCVNGYQVRECACPRPAFGGASCTGDAVQACGPHSTTCSGGRRYIPGVGCGCNAGETYNGSACVTNCAWGPWGTCVINDPVRNSGTQTQSCPCAASLCGPVVPSRSCCQDGYGWVTAVGKCQVCPYNYVSSVNSAGLQVCLTCAQVHPGTVWNPLTSACTCPHGTNALGNCLGCPQGVLDHAQDYGGMIDDGVGGCTCPEGMLLDSTQSPPCKCPLARELTNGTTSNFICPEVNTLDGRVVRQTMTPDRCQCHCDDYNECTGGDYTPPPADVGGPGTCNFPNLDGIPCGSSAYGTCDSSGTCVCDDGKECTTDAYSLVSMAGGVPQYQCVFTPIADGTSCGTGSTCISGVCTACTGNCCLEPEGTAVVVEQDYCISDTGSGGSGDYLFYYCLNHIKRYCLSEEDCFGHNNIIYWAGTCRGSWSASPTGNCGGTQHYYCDGSNITIW